MDRYGPSEEHQPVTWWRGHPIYAAYLVVIVFVASMLVTTLMRATGFAGWSSSLVFATDLVYSGHVWRILTYGLVNLVSFPFVFDMVIIGMFGRELERFFGRRKFLGLFGCLYLITPIVLLLLKPWFPNEVLGGERGALAIFVAFAALYPNVGVFFGIAAKWIAMVVVAVFTLMYLGETMWPELLALWATISFAYGFVRYQQGVLTLPKLRFRMPKRRQPNLRVLPDPAPKAKPAATTSSMAEIDALLDKIARSGISSLTAKERAKLDAARTDMMKRESRRS